MVRTIVGMRPFKCERCAHVIGNIIGGSLELKSIENKRITVRIGPVSFNCNCGAVNVWRNESTAAKV